MRQTALCSVSKHRRCLVLFARNAIDGMHIIRIRIIEINVLELRTSGTRCQTLFPLDLVCDYSDDVCLC